MSSTYIEATMSPFTTTNNNDVGISDTMSINQGTLAMATSLSIPTEAQHSFRSPTREEMKAVFQFCRKNLWNSVLNSVRSNPCIGTTSMVMQNNITTTIVHQAITSKGDTDLRATVVEEILSATPAAAAIKNGYGSLPLHVIAQRNTKMNAATKDRLIRKLLQAYPGALTKQGGVGGRTPLHIIFTGKSKHTTRGAEVFFPNATPFTNSFSISCTDQPQTMSLPN